MAAHDWYEQITATKVLLVVVTDTLAVNPSEIESIRECASLCIIKMSTGNEYTVSIGFGELLNKISGQINPR